MPHDATSESILSKLAFKSDFQKKTLRCVIGFSFCKKLPNVLIKLLLRNSFINGVEFYFLSKNAKTVKVNKEVSDMYPKKTKWHRFMAQCVFIIETTIAYRT